jgi:uncharacterized membrane protein
MIPVQHIHPMIVHFPIVLIFLLAAFDLIAVARGHQVSGRTTAGNISTSIAVLAAISALAAMAFGGMALDFAESGGFSSDVAEIHESLGTSVAIVLSVWALVRAVLWWGNWNIRGAFAAVFPLAAIVGAGLVVATAYYGGQLVFDLGVNVVKVASAG